MTDYPRTRALLGELLGLDGVETQLPLEILTNLHRKQLRAPLENLFALTKQERQAQAMSDMTYAVAVEEFVGERYPALQGANILKDNDRVGAVPWQSDGELRRLMLASQPADDGLQDLLIDACNTWRAHDPVALLHRSSWDPTNLQPLLFDLETELALCAATRNLILDMAREGQATNV